MSVETNETSQSDARADRKLSDADRYEHTQRLKELFELRREADEIYNDMYGEDPVDALNYHIAVRRYITAMESLAKKHVFHPLNDENSEVDEDLYDYWLEWDLGTRVVHPPAELLERVDDALELVMGDELSPRSKGITGLQGFLNEKELFDSEWTVYLLEDQDDLSRVVEGNASAMQPEISHNAFRIGGLFLSDLGIDLEVKESENRAVITEELIEETKQWEEEHL